MSRTPTLLKWVLMANFKTVKIIRLSDNLALIDIDGLNISSTGGTSLSATVTDLSSVCSVSIVSASNGDALVYRSGVWTNEAISAGVVSTASDVLPAYPGNTASYGLTTNESGGYRWRKLKEQDHYISFDGNLVITPTYFEKGQVGSSVSVTFTTCNSTDYDISGYNTFLLNGAAISAADLSGTLPNYNFNPAGGISEPSAFTVTLEAGGETSVESSTITWRYRKYWGVNSATVLSHAQATALTSQALSTAKAGTYSFNADGGKYLWVAWPQSFGSALTFTVGGLATTFTEIALNITNTYAAAAAYYLYKSQELQNGTAVSVVIT